MVLTSSKVDLASTPSAALPNGRLGRLRGFWTRLSVLQICLIASALVHAGVLSFRFAAPETFDKVFKTNALEVVLVNASSSQAPQTPQVLAQSNLEGGGAHDQGRTMSPLPYTAEAAVGQFNVDLEQQTQAQRAQQMVLLTQIKAQLAQMQPVDPKLAAQSPALAEQERQRQHKLKLLAEIEKRILEESKRPKKRYLSPSALSAIHASYYAQFKDKVEDLGTKRFPTVAGRKLYGELTMSIYLDAAGRVLNTVVEQSSGQPELDRQAQRIIAQGAPYGEFNQAMRKEFQILVIVSRMTFAHDATLRTQQMDGLTP